MCKFALASHTLLAIFPSVIQIGDIDSDAKKATEGKGTTSLEPTSYAFLLLQIRDKPSDGEGKDGEQEVVGHLHMIGHYLKSHEKTGNHDTPTVLSLIAKCHTTYRGRYEGQGVKFPDMTCCYDDKVVAGECPKDSTQG